MDSLVLKYRIMRHFFLAASIALVIQLPFLTLMSVAWFQSELIGVWGLFYLPAFWLFDKIGLPAQPRISRFIETVEVVVIQEILLLIVILPFIAIYVRFRSREKVGAG